MWGRREARGGREGEGEGGGGGKDRRMLFRPRCILGPRRILYLSCADCTVYTFCLNIPLLCTLTVFHTGPKRWCTLSPNSILRETL